jgi:hypothetical protein
MHRENRRGEPWSFLKQCDAGALNGPRAEQGTLTLQDLNHLRAYLRLPRLPESNIQLQAYSTNHVGEPVFGIAVCYPESVVPSQMSHCATI